MKKTALASALALTLGSGIASAATMTSATFTMLDSTGGTVGVDTTVTGSIGGGTFSVASTTTFFGANWTAHDGVTFGPGTYNIDTIQGGSYTGVEVGAGQVGGHILFDWGATTDIDVVMVWDVACSGGSCTYTSTDGVATNPANPDGIRGYGMIDGAFPNFNANFDFEVAAVPVPAAVWLFGSGLLGLVGVARRRKSA
ncbi:VPLPA-CTERM sorting domain-containing protein [Thiohalobacter thiocyanaticus]|uniref:VPLPA-CTERM sorting domain-containing protein n=1 Tax=Thiohalobacter thiocyanaticus TaxID=585455 RepID=UPI0019D4BCF8|nr:VPLPA-CTERM sorting domain-containing protein [Thiohalobacter thiocyanaticus]